MCEITHEVEPILSVNEAVNIPALMVFCRSDSVEMFVCMWLCVCVCVCVCACVHVRTCVEWLVFSGGSVDLCTQSNLTASFKLTNSARVRGFLS